MKKKALLLTPVLFFILIYYFTREHTLINDEISLYNFLLDKNFIDIFKLNWSNAFSYIDSEGLEKAHYYRPLTNYIYYFGFKLYELYNIHPIVINWLMLYFISNITYKIAFRVTNSIKYSLIAACIYTISPFNFEAGYLFPNVTDAIIQLLFLSLIYFSLESNLKNDYLKGYYFLIVLIGLLFKESAIILIGFPIASIVIKNKFHCEKSIKEYTMIVFIYDGLFLLAFSIYYFIRSYYGPGTGLDLNFYNLILNFFKGGINYLFLSQDINLIILISPLILLLLVYLYRKGLFWKYSVTYLFSLPVAILLPDDRLFFVSYFLMFVMLILSNNKKITLCFLIIVFSVNLYKATTSKMASDKRENIIKATNLSSYNEQTIKILILPYRIGNEPEIFLNGVNYLFNDNRIIPILVKSRIVIRQADIKIDRQQNHTVIESDSPLIIPHFNNDILHFKGIKVTQKGRTLIDISNYKNKTNYVVINKYSSN